MTEHYCEYQLGDNRGECGKVAHNFLDCWKFAPVIDQLAEPKSWQVKLWLCPEHADMYEGVV